MARITIPTTAPLPSSLRIDPSNSTAARILGRLTRPSLLSLALEWLSERNLPLCAPYILEEEDDEEEEDPEDMNPPVHSLEELRELYVGMQERRGSKREVLDRIIEGDWRHGLSLYQLAMADLQYLYDHPTSQRWTAYRIVPLKPPSANGGGDGDEDEPAREDKESLVIPRFHPSMFLQNLQAQTLPDVKAHYNFDRHKELPILLLRIFVLDSPYNTSLVASGGATALDPDPNTSNFDSSRTIYVAFPDACPYVYLCKPQAVGGGSSGSGGEAKSLRSLVVDGIPKALSRPRERYGIKPTSFTTRNLAALLDRRGAGRTNAAGGAWGVYAGEKRKGGAGAELDAEPDPVLRSPLDIALPTPPLSEGDGGDSDKTRVKKEVSSLSGSLLPPPTQSKKRPVSPATERDQRVAKRARVTAQRRFGNSAILDDGKGVERIDIVIEDAFPEGPSLIGAAAGGDGEGESDESPSQVRRSQRRSQGGRRSHVEKDLQREMEDEEEDVSQIEQPPGTWRPNVRLTFQGSHVFAGIRQLVENGIIDGKRMPGWMTGEEGVTVGAVRHGRIRGHKV